MPNAENSSRNVSSSASGSTSVSRFIARCWFSNSPPHEQVVAGRQLDVRVDALLRLGDERAEVAVAHVHADADVALAVLARDRGAAGRRSSTSASARDRDERAVLERHAQVADRLDVLARGDAAGAR